MEKKQNNIYVYQKKIRHIIHHPENKNNSYSDSDIKQYIENIRTYIGTKIKYYINLEQP